MSGVARTLRQDARAILGAAIAGADPRPRVAAALARASEPDSARRIILLAFGKAAVSMAESASEVLGERITRGLVVAPHDTPPPRYPRLHFITAAHPVADEHSVAAGAAARALLAAAGADDLVLALISGGGSALLVDPAPGRTLAEIAQVTRELQGAGADIHALNAVRRRLDRLKAGGLAAAAQPARVLCLALSDVPGDDPAIIASGPFSPPDRPPATPVRYEIIGSNADAVRGGLLAAAERGYAAAPGPFALAGEARACGARLGAAALGAAPGAALLFGGETTVTVQGGGIGGRNQEVALASALAIAGASGLAIGCAGTDGIDGPTPAAGAVVDGATVAQLADVGIDARAVLAANDSYTALRAVDALLTTGPTGTNVMDVGVVLRAAEGRGK